MAVLASAAASVLCDGAAAQWPSDVPAVWSPDGTRVLALGVVLGVTNGIGVLCHDVATGATWPVFRLPRRPPAAFAWANDGVTVIVACDDDRGGTTVHVVPPPEGAPPRRFTIADTARPVSLLARGDEVLLAAHDVVRLDARTGAELGRVRAPTHSTFALHTAGPWVGYVAFARHDGFDPAARPWEVGWLDPRTLARTPLAQFAPDGEWLPTPTPAFAPDGFGFAVVAQHRATGAWAVRVHVGAAVIATLPVLEPQREPDSHDGQALGNVLWSRDGATLWVGSERFVDHRARWQLWRIPVESGVAQVIELGRGGPVRCIGSCGVPVLSWSPDEARFAWHLGWTKGLRLRARPRAE